MVAHLHQPTCYILCGAVLFALSYSSWANFSPLCSFSSSLLMGRWHFNMVTLACHQVSEVLQSAGCSSRNLFCSPPSSTTPKPGPAAEYRDMRILNLDTGPNSLNNSPAWAQMSCQAGSWCCFKFAIIYFSNLISKMEVHISAHDFQLIFYFLSAFQCFWNALCYRQNTLIMMGLFF